VQVEDSEVDLAFGGKGFEVCRSRGVRRVVGDGRSRTKSA